MSSVARAYAKRNNNVTQIIPEYYFSGTNNVGHAYDVSGSVYTLNIPNLQNTGGIFYVDMSGTDTAGDLLDYTGLFTSNGNAIPLISFIINVLYPASYAPGLEFTIFFKNVPYARIKEIYDVEVSDTPTFPPLTIGLGAAFSRLVSPYIFSPPVPTIIAPVVIQSLTFKSDGTDFNVVSSGPAGWLGPGIVAVFVGGGL
jgi:hypothetical protein